MANYAMHVGLSCLPSRKKYSLCSLPLHRKYRAPFEIMASMLEIMSDNGTTLGLLMERSCVSFELFKRYLRNLTELGLIETERKEGRTFYKTSDKGLNFLRQYYALLEMLSNNQGNNQCCLDH